MLLRSVLITDPESPHHGQQVDVRVRKGTIDAVADSLDHDGSEPVFDHPGIRLSPGFVDIGAYLGDPGHEEREDIESLTASARAGGYVAVAVLPNTDPVRQTVADMSYLRNRGTGGEVDLLPLAAISRNAEGADLTEMMELAEAGALAFTDGPGRATTAGLLKRALEYTRSFGGAILQSPYDPELAEEGQIHEGAVSVQLGLRGIPVMCETIPLRRNLSLLEYTGGRMIAHLLSSAEGLKLIRDFGTGENGLAGCTVGAHHLSFTEEALTGFDPSFKVLPPLRGTVDREALRAGVVDGTVTAIASHHRARHGEEKDLEFSYASFGALALETTLRQQLLWARDAASLDAVIRALTSGPRRLLGLEPVSIREGAPAALTLFTTEGEATLTAADLRGKTKNSPLLGHTLPGRILATVNNNRLWTSV